mgnify:CR=1 FL=1
MILVAVEKDGKWGVINQREEEIIPYIYDDVRILVMLYLIYTIKLYI